MFVHVKLGFGDRVQGSGFLPRDARLLDVVRVKFGSGLRVWGLGFRRVASRRAVFRGVSCEVRLGGRV